MVSCRKWRGSTSSQSRSRASSRYVKATPILSLSHPHPSRQRRVAAGHVEHLARDGRGRVRGCARERDGERKW
jgi:hypothetical protein